MAVVALWPLKGYRIEAKAFVDSLGMSDLCLLPYEVGYLDDFVDPEGRPHRIVVGNYEGNQPACVTVYAFETPREAEGEFGLPLDDCFVVSSDGKTSALHARVWVTEFDGNGWFGIVFQVHNVTGSLSLDGFRVSSGKEEEAAVGYLKAILGGIDREIPGVSTFYNPPARQLWHDRVRPFVGKHFPTLLYLRNDTH